MDGSIDRSSVGLITRSKCRPTCYGISWSEAIVDGLGLMRGPARLLPLANDSTEV